MFWNPKWIGVKWFEFQYASDIWIMNHRITYKMLNWIRIRQWTNNKRILHSLINEELRQIFDTGLEIFSTNVIFPVQFSGLVQIFNFLCAYVIQMKKKTKLPGKTSWKVPVWLFFYCQWPFTEKIQFATLSTQYFVKKCLSLMNSLFSQKIFTPNCYLEIIIKAIILCIKLRVHCNLIFFMHVLCIKNWLHMCRCSMHVCDYL